MSRRWKMQSITSVSKYLLETAEITERENGIYSYPIPHITAGMQANIDLFGHPKWGRDYLKSGIQAHMTVPIVHAGKSIALLSLQWQQPCSLRPDELTTVRLAAQQISLVIASFQ